MAQIVDRAVQSSLSTGLVGWRTAGSLKLHKAGSFSKSTQCRPSRQGVVVATISKEVQTKEAEAGTKTQNGVISSRGGAVQMGAGKEVKLQARIYVGKKKRSSRDEKWQETLDTWGELFGHHVTLQFVSLEIDPVTKQGKRSNEAKIKDWGSTATVVDNLVQYSADVVVDRNFGNPGAVIVRNGHQNEIFVDNISLTGPDGEVTYFVAHSWLHSEKVSKDPRVFFSNQVYLPSSTPTALKGLREQDLDMLRGNGTGRRQQWEQIYDYDVYNDLGDEDTSANLVRPTLGTKELPYPRRNRTGRDPSKSDPTKESRVTGTGVNPYVPRDENFEPLKQDNFFVSALRGLVQQHVPDLVDYFMGRPDEFDSFDEIDRLYTQGVKMEKNVDRVADFLKSVEKLPITGLLPEIFRSLLEATADAPTSLLKYPQPQILSRDKFSWLQDGEFGRQCLAGLNPCGVERLKVFPPVSALDNPELYGPKESSITADDIADNLGGLTVEQALDQGKLFILDYHDVFIPYINRINELGDRSSYASRTLFFLTNEGTLEPIAIELSLPPPKSFNHVYLPYTSSTLRWLWKMAKAHVGSNDAGYHQLYSHWVRTHACTEPYSIATNRHLSAMHPIYKLLHPHLRYTMEINAAARQSLIPAGGVIEGGFLPGRYAMELSAVAYDLKWRFDQQGLPNDLLSRGMAVEDPSAPHGLKLLIEDYPFANDGLLIWSCLESWVTEYVSIYYKCPESIQKDIELQRWWEEIRTVGHADKKDEDWWPKLECPKDLVNILSTMMWVTSGLHAAVNFGQFNYAGFMPNKPTLMRKSIPQPGTPEYKAFLDNPQLYFLTCLPSQIQSTTIMAVLESLSTHSPDEEYLGTVVHPQWFGCPEAIAAFNRYQQKLSEADAEIHSRNDDPERRNRNGAGILPYELLLPTSTPGITGRGVPNSISI